jgi:hypothetical protein
MELMIWTLSVIIEAFKNDNIDLVKEEILKGTQRYRKQ